MKLLIRSSHTVQEMEIWPGETVFETLRRASLPMDSYCGGQGTCGKCKVYWVQGEREVLACQLPSEDGMIIETRTNRDVQILASSLEKEFLLNPIISIEGDTYGVAVDIGTTTIVGYLLNLQTGQECAVTSMANPQRVYGADVISRIAYTQENPGGIEELRSSLVQALNEILARVSKEGQIPRERIKALMIVGNTVILHTLLGISAISIANAPFEPVFTEAKVLSPGELGIDMGEEGKIFTLPCVSGYVGADILGGLLVCDLEKQDSYSLLIDIGTNGELVLGNKDKMIACSTAAGPAFEGAKISWGMAGVQGAIASFHLRNGERVFETIGGGGPLGICGSGLMDIMAELLTHGFIDSTGAFVAPERLKSWQRDMLTTVNGTPAFVVVPGSDITLTQRDVREVQLAKGAIRAGIFTLLKEAQMDVTQVGTVYLAGGFGNFIDVHSACVVGLIPEELERRVVRIGNGAGLGGKLCLLDKDELERAKTIKECVQYVELSTCLDFQELFMEAMLF